MQILDQTQIERKVKRLALEIAEQSSSAEPIYIGGINTRGQQLARMLIEQIESVSDRQCVSFSISLSPADPVNSDISFSLGNNELSGKHVIVVDDVANTGRTLFYACKPLMHVLPASLRMAVLVDRKHKAFPIHVNFVGLSLSTTLQENIDVKFEDGMSANLN